MLYDCYVVALYVLYIYREAVSFVLSANCDINIRYSPSDFLYKCYKPRTGILSKAHTVMYVIYSQVVSVVLSANCGVKS